MTYELWDQASGNRIEGFEGPKGFRALIEVVRQIAALQGAEAVDDLFVEVWTTLDAIEPVEIIGGHELRRLVQPLVKTYALEVAGPAFVPARTRTSQATFDMAVAV